MVKNQTLLQKDSILQNKVNSLIEWLSLERKRSIIFSSIKDILNVLSHYHNADLNLKHQVLNIENFCNNLINVLEANPKVKKTKKSTAQQEIQEVLEVPQLEKKSRVPWRVKTILEENKLSVKYLTIDRIDQDYINEFFEEAAIRNPKILHSTNPMENTLHIKTPLQALKKFVTRSTGKQLDSSDINILKAIIVESGLMRGINSTFLRYPMAIRIEGKTTTISYNTLIEEVANLWESENESNEKFIEWFERTFIWLKYKIQRGINLTRKSKEENKF